MNKCLSTCYVDPGTVRLRKVETGPRPHSLYRSELQYNPRSVWLHSQCSWGCCPPLSTCSSWPSIRWEEQGDEEGSVLPLRDPLEGHATQTRESIVHLGFWVMRLSWGILSSASLSGCPVLGWSRAGAGGAENETVHHSVRCGNRGIWSTRGQRSEWL